MLRFAPDNYICPICRGLDGSTEGTHMRASDFIYRDTLVTVFIGSFFVGSPQNYGYPLIVPNGHFESVLDIKPVVLYRIAEMQQLLAEALFTSRNCEGITIRQNNGKAGGQHAFHYHVHVVPRTEDDKYEELARKKLEPTPEEREPYARQLQQALEAVMQKNNWHPSEPQSAH